MLKFLFAVILAASLGAQTIEELDEQFRADILEIIPEDFASISMGYLMEDAAGIADLIYSPHAEMLGDSALSALSAIPSFDSTRLDGLVLRDSVDLETLRLLDMLIPEEGGDIDGYLYLLHFWNPANAAGYTKSIILGWILNPGEYGGRTMAERLVPDEYFLLESEAENPVVAIVSLRDIFTVEMMLDESGCFLPLRLEWYEKDIAD
jgi:hypothetical protein